MLHHQNLQCLAQAPPLLSQFPICSLGAGNAPETSLLFLGPSGHAKCLQDVEKGLLSLPITPHSPFSDLFSFLPVPPSVLTPQFKLLQEQSQSWWTDVQAQTSLGLSTGPVSHRNQAS